MQGEKYRGQERPESGETEPRKSEQENISNIDTANMQKIESDSSSIGEEKIETDDTTLESKKNELNKQLKALITDEQFIDQRIIGQKALSMLNTAIHKNKKADEIIGYVADGIKHNVFKRSGLSRQQRLDLQLFAHQNAEFKGLVSKVNNAETKIDKQLLILQKLFEPENYNNGQTPELGQLLPKLIFALEDTIIKNAEDDGDSKEKITLLDKLGKSEFSYKQRAYINIENVIQREKELSTLLNNSQRSDEENQLTNDLTSARNKDEKVIERYLNKAIGALVSQEKAYLKGDRYNLFERLDQLVQVIAANEKFSIQIGKEPSRMELDSPPPRSTNNKSKP